MYIASPALLFYHPLEYLHGVRGRALAYLVAAAPQRKAVFIRQILSHTAHPDKVLIARVKRRGVVAPVVVLYEAAARKRAYGLVRRCH